MNRIPWILAAVLFALALALFLTGRGDSAGRFVMGFFLALAVAFQRHERLKGFSFTTVIFAAVACAMYYPSLFIQWGDFKLSGLIIPLVQLIMFGMGVSMSLSDFASVVRSPKGVVIGVVAQFVIMSSLGFFIARTSGFPPEIAAGIVLIGCSPSGLASNVMSYLAKANVPLSLTVTSVTTLLAPFVTPLLMERLAGTYIQIDAVKMMWDIGKMILLPIGAGLLVNRLFYGKTAWMDRVMPLLSMAAIAMIIVVITAAGRDSLLSIGPQLIGWVLVHNLAGYALGYFSARALKMPERDCRTVALEVGMQNGGLASGIAKELGKIATVGLAPAVFGPLMNITGSMLASYWHRKPPAPDNGRSPD